MTGAARAATTCAHDVRMRARRSSAVLRGTFENPALRRVLLGWAASMTGENVAAVGLAVLAYDAGGATAVGLVAVAQMVPAAVAGPVTALLGDRCRRERVVVGADLVRSAALVAIAAVAALAAPLAVLLLSAAVLSVVTSAFYPAQTSLVPLLARSTEEVTAATAASSLVRNLASLAAPAAAGALLLALPPAWLFCVAAACFAAAALLVRGVPGTEGVRSAPALGGRWAAVASGFRAAADDPAATLVLGVFLGHAAARGALGVLLVVVPLELLGTGRAGVGFLTAVLGLGAFLGAVAATSLAGSRRLAGPMGLGLALTGAPLVLAAGVSAAPVVVLAVAVGGAGLAIASVTGTTLLVRAVRDDVLSRVLGVLGTVRALGLALGAGITPVLLTAVGLRWTLCVVGGLVLALQLAVRRRLRSVDDSSAVPEHELALLRAAPVFAPLPPVALERLAGRLEPVGVPTGATVVDEGDVGDCAYLLAEGELLVEAADPGGVVDRMGPGAVFGEMALLHGARRNATVRAASDCRLYRLPREEFLAAVTGHPESAVRASELVAARLAHRQEVLRQGTRSPGSGAAQDDGAPPQR